VTLEELCENAEQREKYDAIIASELIEHINDVDGFIGNLGKLLKVNQSFVFSFAHLNILLAERFMCNHNIESNDCFVCTRNYCS